LTISTNCRCHIGSYTSNYVCKWVLISILFYIVCRKKVSLYFCSYLQQMLTAFQFLFTGGRLSSELVVNWWLQAASILKHVATLTTLWNICAQNRHAAESNEANCRARLMQSFETVTRNIRPVMLACLQWRHQKTKTKWPTDSIRLQQR